MAFDIIVLGGGSAGCAMAGRLSEDGRLKVLLLEAGASDRHPFTRVPALVGRAVQNPDFDWCYRAEPDPSIGGRVDVWAAGKRLGGGSAINGMMFIRGHRHDYDHWAELGARGWDYEGVLPYFRRMEANECGGDRWRGEGGPQAVSENRARYALTDAWIAAAVESGIARCPDLNGVEAEGVDRVQMSQKKGWRHSTATGYIWPARNRPGLAVELGAVATRIRIENGRATGVDYVQNGQRKSAEAGRGVVLCAGSMNSPRLLMLSGIGPAAHLRDMGIDVVCDLPGVGANLQDHVGAHVVNDVNRPTLNSEVQGVGGVRHLLDFALRRRGALTTSIGHAHAFVRTRAAVPAPNIQIIFAPFAFDFDEEGRLQLRNAPAISQAVGVMRPKTRGSVTLRSPDPFASPVIRHQLLGDEDDLDQLCEGLEAARRIIAQPAFRPFVVGEVRPGPAVTDRAALRAYARKVSIPMYHPVGTCKMGVDAMSVVGPGLQVSGVDGLWVADASIMPTVSAGNTNATAIMIGDKGADLVKGAVLN